LSTGGRWRTYFHPAFRARYEALRAAAREIGRTLPEEEARRHPTVKLLGATNRLLNEIVPTDPNAPEFRLSGSLSKFRRARGHGLPERYRLFWVFSTSQRIIIVLYLNDEETLRQAGSRTDPYAVFSRLVERGEIGADFAANWEIVEAERRRSEGERGPQHGH
jgi:toxin YhaV